MGKKERMGGSLDMILDRYSQRVEGPWAGGEPKERAAAEPPKKGSAKDLAGFEAFRRTRRLRDRSYYGAMVARGGGEVPDLGWIVYGDEYHIELWESGPLLVIGTEEWDQSDGDLADLEAILYDWARDNGWKP